MDTHTDTDARRYESARVLLFDPVAANLQVTRGVLYTMGFRQFEQCTEIDRLRKYLEAGGFDLLIAETDGAAPSVVSVFKNLRHGDLGSDPFLILIATAWTVNDKVVRAVVNSGADDLIMRPFSTLDFANRLRSHIDARKQFVVTSEYIGPDRRKRARAGPTAKLIAVPNSLRAKVLNEPISAAQAGAAIAATFSEITNEKLRRDAFQIAFLARMLSEQSAEAGDIAANDDATYSQLKRLLRFAEDLNKRLVSSDWAHVCDVVAATLKQARAMVRRVRDGEVLASKDFVLLLELANALQISLHPGEDEASVIAEIGAAVSAHNLRRAS